MWSVCRPFLQGTGGKLGVKGGLPRRKEPVPRLCVLVTDGGVVPHDHGLRQVGANRTDACIVVGGDWALVEIKFSELQGVPGKEVIHVGRAALKARFDVGGVRSGGVGVGGVDSRHTSGGGGGGSGRRRGRGTLAEIIASSCNNRV